MLKSVLIGLLILVLAVFGFVGYNSYSAKQHATSDEVFSGGEPLVKTASAATTDRQTAKTMSTGGGGSDLSAEGGSPTGGNGTALPTSDSLPASPPEGEKFGGGGSHYQLYRQGDLTWRLNTDTGETCVLFATDQEWKKPRVYRAGCRGHN